MKILQKGWRQKMIELAAKVDDDEIKETRAVYRYLLSGGSYENKELT